MKTVGCARIKPSRAAYAENPPRAFRDEQDSISQRQRVVRGVRGLLAQSVFWYRLGVLAGVGLSSNSRAVCGADGVCGYKAIDVGVHTLLQQDQRQRRDFLGIDVACVGPVSEEESPGTEFDINPEAMQVIQSSDGVTRSSSSGSVSDVLGDVEILPADDRVFGAIEHAVRRDEQWSAIA